MSNQRGAAGCAPWSRRLLVAGLHVHVHAAGAWLLCTIHGACCCSTLLLRAQYGGVHYGCLCCAPLPSCSVDVRNSNQQFPDSRPQVGGEMSGWEVACLKSCPFIGPISDSAVEFGELLGAGSFGRVYRAR